MIIGPRRIVLIGVIAAIAGVIILLPLIVSLPAANDLNRVDVRLSGVTVTDVREDELDLKVAFTLTNPTDITATTSLITYDLLADGQPIATARALSYQDIPLNGRPPIFPQDSVEVTDTYTLELDSRNEAIYGKIRDDPESVRWSVENGEAQIETGLTFVTKAFANEI